MLTIARLFGRSPFAPLQTHMTRVADCIDKLTQIFQAVAKKDREKLEKLSTDLSKLEHEADLTKNDIRNTLPKSLFMPIDRGHFLDVLSIQDSIADKAEHIGIWLTLRSLEPLEDLETEIQAFYKKAAEVFWASCKIIREIDELLESSFGGLEAEKVKRMVDKTSHLEYECNLIERALLKKLFQHGDSVSHSAFYLWRHLIEEIGALAALSEKLANRIRMVLELK
jgi:predicted phosphate transport protein (TIGR00153 family)